MTEREYRQKVWTEINEVMALVDRPLTTGEPGPGEVDMLEWWKACGKRDARHGSRITVWSAWRATMTPGGLRALEAYLGGYGAELVEIDREEKL